MVTAEIYIEANAPTVAENAIKGAIWYGTPTAQTVRRSIDHAAQQYSIPRTQYHSAIKKHLDRALSGPDGLKSFIRSQAWRYPHARNIKKFLRYEWETEMDPNQIIKEVRRVSA